MSEGKVEEGLGKQIIAILSNYITFPSVYSLRKFCDENGLDQSFFLDSSELGSFSISSQTHALMLHLDEEGEYVILYDLIKDSIGSNEKLLKTIISNIGPLLQERGSMLNESADIVPLSEQITLVPQEPKVHSGVEDMTTKVRTNKIFIVHGHDEGMKDTVCRRLEKMGLEPIVLHEQPDRGRTIIEKFIDYSEVECAVVLLSPDDAGYPNGRPEDVKPRARQNVILELGFFIGKLGREKVIVLYKGEEEGIEIPSDYSGVLYISFKEDNLWKLKFAQELQCIGFEINMSQLF